VWAHLLHSGLSEASGGRNTAFCRFLHRLRISPSYCKCSPTRPRVRWRNWWRRARLASAPRPFACVRIGYVQPLSRPIPASSQAARVRMMRFWRALASCIHVAASFYALTFRCLLPRCRSVQARHPPAAVAVAPQNRSLGIPCGAATTVIDEVRIVGHNACVCMMGLCTAPGVSAHRARDRPLGGDACAHASSPAPPRCVLACKCLYCRQCSNCSVSLSIVLSCRPSESAWVSPCRSSSGRMQPAAAGCPRPPRH
jgi:hypothetical protein